MSQTSCSYLILIDLERIHLAKRLDVCPWASLTLARSDVDRVTERKEQGEKLLMICVEASLLHSRADRKNERKC